MSGVEYLNSLLQRHPESEEIKELKQLYEQKLWHQLSQKLLKSMRSPVFQTKGELLNLYKQLVSKFETKISPLELVIFGITVAQSLPNLVEAAEFLKMITKIVQEDEEASLLCEVQQLMILIKQNNLTSVKERLDECGTKIEGVDDILDNRVHSAYYLARVEYHRIKGKAGDFFRNALLYLAYTNLNELNASEQVQLACDIATAALVGDVYSFGELLQHPIVKCLNTTEYSWLSNILQAFSIGDISAYNQLINSSNQEVLKMNQTFLNQKIRVMALIEAVFTRTADERQLTFSEISNLCQLPEKEVELLLMKAFSLEVVRGKIDQVKGKVAFTWVQPRVLSETQLKTISSKLDDWADRTTSMAQYVQQTAADILQ